MDPREVGKATAMAGGMCGLAALVSAPHLCWIWLVAGIAAGLTSGYVSYDFKKVVWAIPIAWQRTKVACGAVGSMAFGKIKAFFRQPHPIGYGAVLGGLVLEVLFLGGVIGFALLLFGLPESAGTPPPTPSTIPLWGSVVFAQSVFWLAFGLISSILLVAFAERGGKIERCFFLFGGLSGVAEIKQRQDLGHREVPFTYRVIYHLAWVGFRRAAWNVFAFFFWRGWVWLWLKACFIGRFYRRFGWELFRLIHEEGRGRVASALYGTAGGVTGLLLGYPYAIAIPERALLVFFCALLGFAFGRGVACELVAKRWLGLAVRS
ncbi:hypothetical protein HYW68_01600 [Candidatus Parcubacteria bacterium]|nr:hypothetical protein [Candidatus Parcubacteria bacterium]